uniref:ShKT domain-containing protein n=1 Tax=Romanomermis culicivorax TaxID=13658 RepID=A0A915K2M7_ROMCU
MPDKIYRRQMPHKICAKGPCRDVYKSCGLWESENRCDWARHMTRFFDINCARSCRVCKTDATIGKV